MTDFQFSLDGAALFMLLFTQKLLTSASSQSDTFGPSLRAILTKKETAVKKYFMIWVVSAEDFVPYLVGFV